MKTAAATAVRLRRSALPGDLIQGVRGNRSRRSSLPPPRTIVPGKSSPPLEGPRTSFRGGDDEPTRPGISIPPKLGEGDVRTFFLMPEPEPEDWGKNCLPANSHPSVRPSEELSSQATKEDGFSEEEQGTTPSTPVSIFRTSESGTRPSASNSERTPVCKRPKNGSEDR